MKNKPILIVAGQPRSIFFEIFFKSIKNKHYKCPIILIASLKLLRNEMKKLNYKNKINLVSFDDIKKNNIFKNRINIFDVKLYGDKNKIQANNLINKYIINCFDSAFKIIKSGYTNKLINGPINKKKFLNKKFLGITEFISKKFKVKENAMLIYNKNLSVCPATTHLPIKLVSKNINKFVISNKIELIQNFYKNFFKINPKIGVVGLNPHCETILKYNEDIKIIEPMIKKMSKNGFKISGPYPADTVFLKTNRKKFDVILGMYHDQVLTPIKTLYEYDAINITLGLPFLRISPDHGPNEKMVGKNLSNPLSLIKAIKFLDKI